MSYNSLFLDSVRNIDYSWNPFLKPEIIKLVKKTEAKILKSKQDFTPAACNVLRFLQLPINKTKILILGQDPYPQEGVATGRAFEVGTLTSWNDKYSNISLKNIVRAIYSAYYNDILTYNEIKSKIGNSFGITPPDKLFLKWEEQGVLLLNTSFTCKTGAPNSHEKLWEAFTHKLLRYIAEVNHDIIWFIWGNNAKNITEGINIKHKIESMHPMMCYNKPGRGHDFLYGKINPFKQTKDIINWLG